ncbi:MAG TPA: acyl-CoA dehydratase activase, partial [Candidatus Nanoarchaeia archaeon]|nr:acyl-CoA dehydratase activase [Candidatus Nanoarchaeia archaeon]
MNKTYLGVDVGSISTNVVLLCGDRVIHSSYIRTSGNPARSVKEGLIEVKSKFGEIEIAGVGTTGSARKLIGELIGADIVKNEITAHAMASTFYCPNVSTIIEIGGQDSKLIILKNGTVVDFCMNSVCAAGTGSFLDSQANRLRIPIEEFGGISLNSKDGVNIAGRCTVFAESDMIHKQQIGHKIEDILYGLCKSLVRNYLNNLSRGRELYEPIMFQGGVSENKGIIRAFEESLGKKLI